MDDDRFGFFVKQRRKALDLTQDDLARLVGCAAVTIQKIEEGRRRPSKQVAALLADYLAVVEEEREAFLRLARRVPPSPIVPPVELQQPVTPTNLPAPLTPLIGRATEVAAVWNYLIRPDIRLVSLVGPPGVGKTRLSVQVAGELREQFPDGVWFVALAAIHEPHLVMPTVARALELTEAGTLSLAERLQAALRTKRVLLVLDNLEQVVEAAPQITALLRACGQVKVLATSRVPLHVYGEQEYQVEPFALPPLRSDVTPERLIDFEAVRLFVARAQAFQPTFALSDANAQAIAEVCARLDGLPLAIELAAARIRQFTPAALVVQVRGTGDSLFPLLSHGPRDLPARQQTLHHAITWSYKLLSPAHQHLFRQLGVFVGGWTLAAATAVCTSANVDTLHALGSYQLLRHDINAEPQSRWSMLEMIRAYALAELNAQHEYDATAQAHAAYFLHLAETEPDEPMWLAQMAQEHDNLRAVLRWAVAHDARETGLRLCIALWWFWDAYGHWNEGRQWTETMLAAAEHAAPHYRMGALRCVAEFAWKQGDHVHADKVLKEILTLAQVVNHPAMSAHATMLLGKIALDQGDVVVADSLLHQSVAMWQSLGDNALVPRLHLGELALVMGEYVQARHILEENLALCEATDDMFFTVVTLRALGEALIGQGEHQAARKLLREGIAHSQIIDHQRVLVTMLTTFASALASGSHPQANDVCIAARIWAAVQVVRDDVGMFVSVGDRIRYEKTRAYAQTQVSANAWIDAWEQGRRLSLNQVTTLALSLPEIEL